MNQKQTFYLYASQIKYQVFFIHHDGILVTKCFSLLFGLIFVKSRSGKTRRPNGLIAVGLRSYSSKNCRENVTLKAGLDGLAASLIA